MISVLQKSRKLGWKTDLALSYAAQGMIEQAKILIMGNYYDLARWGVVIASPAGLIFWDDKLQKTMIKKPSTGLTEEFIS